MRAILVIAFLAACATTAVVAYKDSDQLAWWDTDEKEEHTTEKHNRIPFPQCLVSGSKSRLFDSSSVQRLFDETLRKEEEDLKQEGYDNYEHDNDGLMDYDTTELRRGRSESQSAARAAISITREIMTVLMCDLNGTDASNLNNFLAKFPLPKEFCSYLDKPNCDDKRKYRTATGVCNNLAKPYQGSSQTAFARLVSPAYADHLSEPRRKSVRGGMLPSCRRLSLSLGSKPIFDRNFNNFFVIFGQVISHDVALSTPVGDSYLRPISSCKCGDKYNWNKCTVIDVEPDDPYLRGQRCMAFPATAQAFKNQICSLGVKEQINGNTHLPDLSVLYGSTQRTAQAVRGLNGLMKSTRPNWSKYEIPPGQVQGKSCVDSTTKHKCLAGGDSRVMINLLFTGIQSIFLRLHNLIARDILVKFPNAGSNHIYETARQVNIAFYQRIVFKDWLPTLLGQETYQNELGAIKELTKYNEKVAPVVFNEFATAAFRLHTLVRDLFSRCTYDGKRIDQLWLHDILLKSKYAYDVENNGLDSILCGSLYDYGFSYDSNFAHQIHHRLFETTNKYGQTWRNDLVAINICRGREHGIPSYNTLRKYCKFDQAETFEDFGHSINYDGIQKLKKMYKHPDDVDLFVGLNMEDPMPGGLVGRVGACIIGEQFKAFRDGDRLFYSHEGVLPTPLLKFVESYPLYCLVCKTVDIEQVPENPFRAPSDEFNELKDCSKCPAFNAIDFITMNLAGDENDE